jgi:hypothetical protein
VNKFETFPIILLSTSDNSYIKNDYPFMTVLIETNVFKEISKFVKVCIKVCTGM